MVHIPTTSRKFYDNSVKADSLGMTARAVAPAIQDMQKTFAHQQDIKIDTNTTKARIEIDELNNQWRLQNQANPNSPEARLQLQTGIQDILNKYGEGIDPSAKMKWNIAANKLTSAYEMSNNQWAITQRAQNAKLDVAENINANLQIARSAGRAGDLQTGIADYVNSYSQLYKYASQNMGETEAKALLMDYEENYMTSFIDGLAEADPKAAMEAMKDPQIVASFKKQGSQDVMMKIINKQIAKQNFEIKVAQFNNEQKLSAEMENMPTLDALHVLEQNEGNVSSSYFKAKKNALMSAKGITAETRAETSTEILLDLAMLPKDSGAVDYFDASNKLVAKIEQKYADGYLSTADKKNLLRSVYNMQGKNIGELKKDTSDDEWFSWGDYTYKDAWEHIDGKYVGSDKNQVLLEYFRAVNGQDLTKKQKIAALDSIINYANVGDLQLPRFANVEEAKEAIARGKVKKGDKVYINGVRGTL